MSWGGLRSRTAYRHRCVLSGTRPRQCKKVFSSSSKCMREQLGKEEEWDRLHQSGNPCGTPLVDSYSTFTGVEQKKVGVSVNQADAILTHTLLDLLQGTRSRAQVAPTAATLAFASMRRGCDLSRLRWGHRTCGSLMRRDRSLTSTGVRRLELLRRGGWLGRMSNARQCARFGGLRRSFPRRKILAGASPKGASFRPRRRPAIPRPLQQGQGRKKR